MFSLLECRTDTMKLNCNFGKIISEPEVVETTTVGPKRTLHVRKCSLSFFNPLRWPLLALETSLTSI